MKATDELCTRTFDVHAPPWHRPCAECATNHSLRFSTGSEFDSRTKDTREGKMRHSAAGRETGSTANAKHSGHSVGKTTQRCQWQSLSISCCSRLISGLYVIRGDLKDASHKNKRPIGLRYTLFCNSVNCIDPVKMGFHRGPIGCQIIHNVRTDTIKVSSA